MKATWNKQVIAESDNTVVVENNHYFPKDAIHSDFFAPSHKTSVCGWKGEASYFNIVVDGQTNRDAAWTYKTPKSAAENIKEHIAFWKGVEVTA